MVHLEQQCIRPAGSIAEHIVPAVEMLLLEPKQSCQVQAVHHQGELLWKSTLAHNSWFLVEKVLSLLSLSKSGLF